MSETFNSEMFERLTDIPLGMYAVNLVKSGSLPPDCLNYFKANARRWDGQHLECGLYFLSKIGSTDANHEIANHIDHPLKHIRYTVLGMLNDMRPLDDYMFMKLCERLLIKACEFEAEWVERLSEKARIPKDDEHP